MQLKEDCRSVHVPCQVAVSLRTAHKAEHPRLLQSNIIAEVYINMESIKAIVPVKKQDGILSLCLDPKDLKQGHRGKAVV